MSEQSIKTALEQALLHDGDMSQELYQHELAETVDFLKKSLKRDREDYIFSVTSTQGVVAMIMVDKTGLVYANEEAREKLKAVWPAGYESTLKMFIPAWAEELNQGEIPLMGFTIVN